MAILYRVDGKVMTVTPQNQATGFTLDELHDLISVKTLDFRAWIDNHVMVCDDEGLLKPDPQINVIATLLWWKIGGDPNYPLAGNILVATRREVQ